ncbi:MAG: bifunctional DNA primase/polymerase [Pseudorhodoplanes sp.]|nr:bifunctional DNA primase/polymerase [Pseudorhodoplanes sp.]
MSDVTNEIGRAVEDSAPVDVLSDAARSFDVRNHAPALCPDKPSLPDAKWLRHYVDAGYELIPLNGKKPKGAGWRRKNFSLAECAAWMGRGHNVGVRLHPTDLVVDVDPRNFDDGDDPFARLKAAFGLADAPFVRTGGGGWHFYFRKPAEVAVVNAVAGYKGIEFKSLGRQVVAAGSIHPDTGEPYRLDDDPLAMSLSEAPEVTTALLDAIRKPSGAQSATEAGEITPEQLAEWLEHIDVADYRDGQRWQELMMACHQATSGAGIDEFIDWSVSDPPYADHGETIRRRWNSLDTKRGGITIRTLIAALPKDMRRDAVEAVERFSAEDDFADYTDAEPVSAQKKPAVWNEWVWVADASQFVRRSDGKKYRADQWNSLYARLKPDGSVLNAVWKGNVPIRKFESLVYLPERPEFPDGERGGQYNIWRKAGVEPKPGDVTPFLDHMAYLFPDEGDRNHVLDYLALLVQRPAEKIHFALLVRGAQGTGKSWIGRLMAKMIGRRNVVTPSNDEVTSRWTVWMEGAQLAIIEELMALGRLEVANRLKPVITETTLRIEEKGRSHYSIPNCLNFLCFTNHEDAVPIERGDRRWLVIFSPAAKRNDAYYDGVFEFLKGDGPSFVKRWLLDRKVALNPKGVAPSTSGKEAMRRLSLGDAENHLLELFEQQQHPFDFDLVRIDDLLNAVPTPLQGRANIRTRVLKLLKDEIGAVKHSRYTKDRKHQAFQLWSIRNHEEWERVGAARRADAYTDRYRVLLRKEGIE